ncbi:MAG: hypothetical protein IPK26_19350 [Planctomycetes bacterium]|nr:hypothetical protein [Planctomycetota bacterium]
MERPASPTSKGVLRKDSVRMLPQAALIDCASGGAFAGTIAVVPLMDGERIAGFEIRCGCGASAVVECVYQTESKS